MKGTNTTVAVDERKCVLISYHYFKDIDISVEIPRLFGTPIPRVFLDSGAWSAFKLGATISLDDYIAFIHKHRDTLWCYANLDDMTSDVKTYANQAVMEAAGLEPVPVFHTGDDWGYLYDYVERYPYVALGKIVPYTGSPKKIVPWVGKCMRIGEGKSVYHAFGCSNVALLKLFPFFSSDSSAWGGSYRYGNAALWDETKAKLVYTPYTDARNHFAQMRWLWDEHAHAQWQSLNEYKIRKENIAPVSAIAFMKMAEWLSRARGSRFNFFFASVASDLTLVADGFNSRYPPMVTA